MKKIFLTLMLAVVATLATAQSVTIPGTGVSVRLNSEDWHYLRTFKLDDGADIYLYYYSSHTVVDGEGDTILPFLRIYTKEKYSGDVYELAYDRYMVQPFQSLDEYTHGPGLPQKGGIGYDGVYTNPNDQKDYRFLMTYFIDRGTAVELRLETTKDTFEAMEFEFKDILGTLK